MSKQKVLDAIAEQGEIFRECAESNEKLTRLDDRAAKALRDTGVMRMLQPKNHGGMALPPADFAEAVMEIAKYDGSTGWCAGIVGLHPWELALADPKVQEEVWGEDQDVWIASPYAPMGILTPVEGGYRFSGHWQFSSGTDHCDWIFLGAMLGDAEGNMVMPPESYHVLLPRSDYEIVEDSWDTVGLRGTGSRDIIVKDAFIPEYRAMTYHDVTEGVRAKELGITDPSYNIPFTIVFPAGITSAVIGICEGALAAHLDYARNRTLITGGQVKDDPYNLYAIGEAAGEIEAARTAMLDNLRRSYDTVAAGKTISFEERAQSRLTQVSAAWRAVNAMDQVVARSGGNGMRMSSPIQRFWRDAHMGMVHAIHVPGAVYHLNALVKMGVEPPVGPMRSMI